MDITTRGLPRATGDLSTDELSVTWRSGRLKTCKKPLMTPIASKLSENTVMRVAVVRAWSPLKRV